MMRVGGGPDGEVIVHDRKLVGAYDVATISSEKSDALLGWLSENGFRTDPAIKPTVAEYVSEGWTFVAARLRRDAGTSEAVTPHPLAFTFETKKPVYPLRLTGIGNKDRCTIDLYVFGPERAEAVAFTVKHCEQPEYPSPSELSLHLYPWRPATLTVTHPGLQEFAAEARVATHLRASLVAEQMTDDVRIDWTPFAPAETVLYSSRAAAISALNRVVPVLCVLIFGLYLLLWARKIRLPTLLLGVSVLVLGSSTVAGAMYARLPRTEFRSASGRPQAWRMESALLDLIEKHPDKSHDVAWLEGELRKIWPAASLREDDAPGSCFIRTTPKGLEYVWYDAVGGEHVTLLARATPTTSAASP